MKKTFLTLLLLVVFLPAIFAQNIQAKWVDQSDDLPGMYDFPTGLVIGAGVLITGLVVVLVIKKKQNKKLETSSIENSAVPHLGLTSSKPNTTLYNKLYNEAELSPVQFFAGFDKIPYQYEKSTVALSVGVRLKF